MSGLPAPMRIRHARRVGFAAWGALLALEVVWHAWWHSPVNPPAVTLAIVPLLLPLLAMRRPNRALLWAGFIALFYFAHGVSDAWSMPAERIPALAEAILSVMLVCALGAGVQKHKRDAVAEE